MTSLTTTRLAEGFVFLEGPRWHGERLWFSDMFGGKVYTLTEAGKVEAVVEVPHRPSGLGFLPDGTPLVVSMQDRRVWRIQENGLKEHADLSALAAGNTNDMVVAPNGNAYVGNFGFEFPGGEFRTTNLLLVTPQGEVREVAQGLAFPNGMVIDPRRNRLVVAETFGAKLTAFPILANGDLGQASTFAEIEGSSPDGICLDLAGGIWVSSFRQDVFLRVEEGGEITHRVEVTGRRAVACQLGGSQGTILFCLTAAGSLAETQQGSSRAFVETTPVEVPAAGSP